MLMPIINVKQSDLKRISLSRYNGSMLCDKQCSISIEPTTNIRGGISGELNSTIRKKTDGLHVVVIWYHFNIYDAIYNRDYKQIKGSEEFIVPNIKLLNEKIQKLAENFISLSIELGSPEPKKWYTIRTSEHTSEQIHKYIIYTPDEIFATEYPWRDQAHTH